MSTEHLIPKILLEGYHVREWRNATGILETACPTEWAEIVKILSAFRLLRSEIETAGGGKSPISQGIDSAFYAIGWEEKQFKTSIVAEPTPRRRL